VSTVIQVAEPVTNVAVSEQTVTVDVATTVTSITVQTGLVMVNNLPPPPVDYLGSACTGADMDENRVLTLTNTSLTTAVAIWVDGVMKHSAEYLVTHQATGTTVQFFVRISDSANIIVLPFEG
jgi:hypothetical protein